MSNPYKPIDITNEPSYIEKYYKYASVININGESFLLDGSLVKKRGWEIAIFPLDEKHTEFTLETTDIYVFRKNGFKIKIIPRSIFLYPAKDRESLGKAFYLIRDYLMDNRNKDIFQSLDELEENPDLNRFCITCL